MSFLERPGKRKEILKTMFLNSIFFKWLELLDFGVFYWTIQKRRP